MKSIRFFTVLFFVVYFSVTANAAAREEISLSLSPEIHVVSHSKFHGNLQGVAVGDLLVATNVDGVTPPIIDTVISVGKESDGRTTVEVNENSATSDLYNPQISSTWTVYVIPKANAAAFNRAVSSAASVLSAK